MSLQIVVSISDCSPLDISAAHLLIKLGSTFYIPLCAILALAIILNTSQMANRFLRWTFAEEIQKVKPVAEQVVQGAKTPREKAIKIYNYLRDEVTFGFTPEFDRGSFLHLGKQIFFDFPS
jgi:hypothetical protein